MKIISLVKQNKIIAFIFFLLSFFSILNISYSVCQNISYRNKIYDADKILISACFLTNSSRSAKMASIEQEEEINRLAENFNLIPWSSPLDVLTGNSYMLEIFSSGTKETIFLRCGGGLRLKTEFMYQGLTNNAIETFLNIAESDGVTSEEAFTKIVNKMSQRQKTNDN